MLANANQPSLTVKNNHKVVKNNKPLIKNGIIGVLINLSGRQRMLSQRIVLNTLLAYHGQTQALDLANESLALFKSTHNLLVHGDHEHPGVFFDELENALFDDNQYEQYIQNFIHLAEQTIAACQSQASNVNTEISKLAEMSNAVIPMLNKITMAYENEAKRRYAIRAKKQVELMGNIQKIAKEARIISFNAQIIASRSGDSGREFSVVASVLTDIIEKMDSLAAAGISNNEA